MPGTNNSKFVINDSKLAKKFGIDVRGLETLKRRSKKKGTEKFNVCVPKDEMAHIQELWKNYEAVLKKNRHRKVVDKLRNVTNLGKNSFNESDGSRIASLVNIFQKTDDYITTAEEFFQGCKENKQIKIYADKINKDYEILNGKGYLKGYVRDDKEANEQFDKNRFMVFSGDGDDLEKPKLVGKKENPYEDNYAMHVKEAYTKLYNAVGAAITNQSGFVKNLKDAKNAVAKAWDRDLDDKLKKIHEYFFKMKECDRALDDLAQDVKKHKSEKWIKDNFDSLKEHINTTLERAESINKLSNTKYLETIFYDKDQLAAAKNITTALTGCTRRLDNFGSGIQSGSLKTEDLKKTYRDAVKEFKRFSEGQQVTIGETSTSTTDSSNAKNPMTQYVNNIVKVYKKLDKAFSKLSSAMVEYNREQDKFLVNYYNWKREKKSAKRRTILFVLFGVIGALSAGIIKLLPLVDALGNASTEAPVEPMHS